MAVAMVERGCLEQQAARQRQALQQPAGPNYTWRHQQQLVKLDSGKALVPEPHQPCGRWQTTAPSLDPHPRGCWLMPLDTKIRRETANCVGGQQ